MGFPVPVLTGTIVFIILAFVGGCVGVFLRKTNRLNKDNGQ
jgi:hypothetical protein